MEGAAIVAQDLSIGNLFSKTRNLYYGWWLSGLAGLLMVLTSVPVFHAMTVWAVAMEAQFGWNRTQLGLALTFTRVEGGLMGPVEGYLVDRFGARRMVTIGLVVMAGGFVFFAGVQNLWMFYGAFVVLSMGQGLGGWIPLMTLLNNWFRRRVGTSMGISMMGMGAGALVVVPLIAFAIDPEHNRLGWRETAIVLAGVSLAGAVILPRFIFNRPQDKGLLPDGDRPPDEATLSAAQSPEPTDKTLSVGEEVGFTVRQALKTQGFWCISLGHGMGSMVILAIMAHLGLLMKDLGYSVQDTAWLVSVYTAISIVFQLAGGYIGDRVPKNVALFFFTSLQAGAVVLLAVSSSLSVLYAFAVLFGIGFGGRTPLTTAIRGEYFGRASFGKILGVSTVPMNILLLLAGPMTGYMRDELGDYNLAFLVLAILNGMGALLFLAARKPRLPTSSSSAVSSQPVFSK